MLQWGYKHRRLKNNISRHFFQELNSGTKWPSWVLLFVKIRQTRPILEKKLFFECYKWCDQSMKFHPDSSGAIRKLYLYSILWWGSRNYNTGTIFWPCSDCHQSSMKKHIPHNHLNEASLVTQLGYQSRGFQQRAVRVISKIVELLMDRQQRHPNNQIHTSSRPGGIFCNTKAVRLWFTLWSSPLKIK